MEALYRGSLDQAINLLDRGANPSFVNIYGAAVCRPAQAADPAPAGKLTKRAILYIRDRIVAKDDP